MRNHYQNVIDKLHERIEELEAAIAELEAELARLKAAQGCETCGSIGDQPHGEYCKMWEGGDA